jgi:type VI secretion system protein ImpJ
MLSGRPVWNEGMLLCPQHMQQQDLYHEQNLAARLGVMNALSWGVAAISFDAGAIKAGQLALTGFRGVLPDGTAVMFEATSQSRPASRPIAPAFPPSMRSVEVFLALPTLREGVANYAGAEATAGLQRYKTVTRNVFDLTLARSERELQFSEPNLVLLFGSEPRDDYAAIKVAEVVRDETGGFRLNDEYIPPCLTIGAAPALLASLQDLLSLSVTKRRRLAEERRTRDGVRIEFNAQDITRYLFLQTLSGAIPVLKHFSEAPATSPWPVYVELSRLCGSLMTFSSEGDPAELPAFQYNDLQGAFGKLTNEIKRLLGLVIQEAFVTVPLRARQDNSWIGELRDDRLQRCTQWVLAVEAEGEQQQVANEVPELAKIASWKRIPLVVKNNVLGVPLKTAHRPPPEIPIRPRQVYFLVTTDDPHWREILNERTIAIYIKPPYDPRRAKVTLMGILARED